MAKLPKDRVDELVRSRVGTHFDSGRGRLMKEWVVVGLGKADWVALAKEACRFVSCPGPPSSSPPRSRAGLPASSWTLPAERSHHKRGA